MEHNINSKVSNLEKLLMSIHKDRLATHGLKRAIRALSKEIVLFKNHFKTTQSSLHKKYKSSYNMVQIGGGKHVLKGALNIDIVQPADLVYDVREGLPLNSQTASFIFTEHFFEHIDYPASAKKFISECYRVLKFGGKLIIGVPDTELVIKNYLARNRKFYNKALNIWYKNRRCLDHFNTYIDLVNYHLRDQDDDPKYNPHYWGYDKEKLISLLKSVGFSEIRNWKFDSTIANPKRKYGSIYIEAQK